jgi:sulfur carrier protein
MMNIQINGEQREVPESLSVTELLVELDLNPSLVVVELNREILDRSRYGETRIREGDVLELVHFVGGG